MKYNVIDKLNQLIPVTLNTDDIRARLHTVLDELGTIYSYIVYAKYKNGKLSHWQIEYQISQTDKYNTLKTDNVVDEILKIIALHNEDKVVEAIGFKQPDINVQLQLFDNLIDKLASSQCKQWPQLDYNEAKQLCRITMLRLYNKGYYLHSALLKRCYNNDVLYYFRKRKHDANNVSLEELMYPDDEGMSVVDTIVDEQEELNKEEKEHDEFIKIVFEQVKDLIIELIGERQFNDLMRDYGNQHTTPWSRKKMMQLKDTFRTMGLNWAAFNKYR